MQRHIREVLASNNEEAATYIELVRLVGSESCGPRAGSSRV